MKLPAYDITVIISDPDDPTCHLKIKLGHVPREKVVSTPIPLALSLEMFEQSIEEAK